MMTKTYRWTPDYLGPDATADDLERYIDKVLAALRDEAGDPDGDDVDWVDIRRDGGETWIVKVDDDCVDGFNIAADRVHQTGSWVG